MRKQVRLSTSQPSAGGFTLVELLVVLGIVTLLVAILLPALHLARDWANRIACASNVRQLVMCTLMYANENKGNLPRQGQAQGIHEFSGLVGDFQENPTDPNDNAKKDMDILLGSYVNADVTSWATIPGSPSPGMTVLTGLTEDPPRVLTCPANGQDFYYRIGYGYYAGGTNDFRVTLTQLWNAGKGTRVGTFGIGRGPIPGGNPALWGDRIAYINDPGAGASGWNDSYNGGPAETGGHWNKTANRIAGGNVGHLDGSVLWYGYYGAPDGSGNIDGISKYNISEAYVPNPLEITQQTAIPCDAIFIVPQTGGGYPATLNAQTILAPLIQKEACAGAALAGAGTLFGR